MNDNLFQHFTKVAEQGDWVEGADATVLRSFFKNEDELSLFEDVGEDGEVDASGKEGGKDSWHRSDDGFRYTVGLRC